MLAHAHSKLNMICITITDHTYTLSIGIIPTDLYTVRSHLSEPPK